MQVRTRLETDGRPCECGIDGAECVKGFSACQDCMALECDGSLIHWDQALCTGGSPERRFELERELRDGTELPLAVGPKPLDAAYREAGELREIKLCDGCRFWVGICMCDAGKR
jgi:hypothetical protein